MHAETFFCTPNNKGSDQFSWTIKPTGGFYRKILHKNTNSTTSIKLGAKRKFNAQFFQVQIIVCFSKLCAYPIGIAREQAEHSRKNELDYMITVLRVFLTGSMKTLGTHVFQVLLGTYKYK